MSMPNHPLFPLLVYENAFPADSGSEQVRELFESNRWENTWVNGVYSYHHDGSAWASSLSFRRLLRPV